MNNILIYIIDHNGQKHTINAIVQPNLSLMDVVRDGGVAMGNCGGMALCASCHCSIKCDKELDKKSIEEEQMLDQLPDADFNTSRLICQIPLTMKLDGITLILKN